MDLGAELTAGTLLVTLVVSTVGWALFRYGKKEARLPHALVGIALMAEPLLIASPLGMAAVAAVLGGGLWLLVRCGA